MIPNIFSAYGVNLDSRILDKILYVGDKLICLYNYYTLFYHPSYSLGTMIDSFHFSSNSSLLKIELICLWISERIVLPPALINSDVT
jgi:hypothetical protein